MCGGGDEGENSGNFREISLFKPINAESCPSI